MKTNLIALFLLINSYSFGQYMQGFTITTAYETKFTQHNVNLGLDLDFVELFKNNMHVSLGFAYDYNFNGSSLYDARVSFALTKHYTICYVTYFDYSPALIFVAHYKFNKSIDNQYIVPEIAYNILIGRKLFLTPSISYYLSLNNINTLKENIFLGLKFKIPVNLRALFRGSFLKCIL